MKQIICTVDYFVVKITMYNLLQEIMPILFNTQKFDKKCQLLLQNSIYFLNFVVLILCTKRVSTELPYFSVRTLVQELD